MTELKTLKMGIICYFCKEEYTAETLKEISKWREKHVCKKT